MLKKLSLAALVAMGSMSFAGAATDLSSAIQGVTVGGFLRYRGTEDNVDNGTTKANKTINEYKAVVKVGIKASDTMSVHGTLVYKNKFNTNKAAANNNTAKPFNVTEAYLEYKNAGATVKAGDMNLATPLSDHDDDRGNGVLATYTMNGITGAFGYFNDVANATGSTTLSNNLLVLAAIADIKPAKLQAWYYNVSDSGDNTDDGKYAYFLEAAASISPVTVKAQYAAAKSNASGAKTQKFGALAVVGNVSNVNVTAAYLYFGKN